ncbi:hypothetical protein MPPM_5437 (plasmid) [Methylorubrum populi]|uniref:Uncharacterized protein n=1 Tax=Methylorubrum populi TaxID=223967 RepID=A0A169RJX1_9HYPH|nr:hypothetical protein [Methylorubrum populi]OAH27939.1 hypothetical protein AX289_28955 [Methylorubrum populi]BAU94042.1 hypothetical protein MPPM_5437 [Methylorubrum populi]
MPFKNDLASLVDETHQGKSYGEIAASSVGALGGLTHTEAAKVMDALDVKSIEELATSKYVLWAQAIAHLAKFEKIDATKVGTDQAFNPSLAAILDSKWEKRPLREIAKASPAVLSGISRKEADLLAEALQVKTVEELATNRFVLVAQVIAHLAKYEATSPLKKAA